MDFAGCPVSTGDADGDGISDELDRCPYASGLEEDKGCPVEAPELDSDGDGTSDLFDACPDAPGAVEYGGCPVSTGDADGDGIPDETDNCPYASGLEEDKGCPLEVPESDSDGDGTADLLDDCPDEPGSIEHGGCPGPCRDVVQLDHIPLPVVKKRPHHGCEHSQLVAGHQQIAVIRATVADESDRETVVTLARRRFGAPGMREHLILGDAAEIRSRLEGLCNRGVERFYVWFTDFAEPATRAAFGRDVIAELA